MLRLRATLKWRFSSKHRKNLVTIGCASRWRMKKRGLARKFIVISSLKIDRLLPSKIFKRCRDSKRFQSSCLLCKFLNKLNGIKCPQITNPSKSKTTIIRYLANNSLLSTLIKGSSSTLIKGSSTLIKDSSTLTWLCRTQDLSNPLITLLSLLTNWTKARISLS